MLMCSDGKISAKRGKRELQMRSEGKQATAKMCAGYVA